MHVHKRKPEKKLVLCTSTYQR